MTESRLPPDPGDLSEEQIAKLAATVDGITAPHAQEYNALAAALFARAQQKILADPALKSPPLQLLAALLTARQAAAGLFASAITLMSQQCWHGMNVNNLATAFAASFNAEMAGVVERQYAAGVAACNNPAHDHRKDSKIEITLTVRVVDPPPPPEENA